jgi:ATP-dependent Lon protease
MQIIHSDLVLFPGVAVNVFPGSVLYNQLQDIIDSVVGIQVYNSQYGCLVLLEKKNRLHLLRGTKRFKIIDSQITIIQDDVDEEDVEFTRISGIFKGKISEFGNLLKQVAPDLGLELEKIVKEKSGLEILFIFVFLMDYSKDQKLKILENEDLKEILEIGIKWVDESLKDFKVSIQKIKERREKGSNSHNDNTEVEELKEKITKLKIPKSSFKSVEKDLKRLARMNSNNADYHVIFSYLEVVADLPWDRYTQEKNISVEEAKEILDQDHYGLDKVKKRILEYIAVLRLTQTLKGPILCLVGPPGTGKTSLGRSIARALGRKFFRVALGGVRDEAQIRGHRRTYIGALPGLLIQAFRKVGVKNPVFLLGNLIFCLSIDEIDKLGTDGRSDPTSALLEVLDPEQNQSFTDSYLNLAFDLSKTVFIATANDLTQIPDPLKDRMVFFKV